MRMIDSDSLSEFIKKTRSVTGNPISESEKDQKVWNEY